MYSDFREVRSNEIQNCAEKVITQKEQSRASDVKHLFDRCQHIASYILPVLPRTDMYGTYACTGCDDYGTRRSSAMGRIDREMMVGRVDRRVVNECVDG